MAASATLALNAGVWFRRARRCMVSPDSQATACPQSGRNSTYRPVQISGAGSETARLDHAGLKGHFREIFIADVLRQIMSSDFIAGTGLVVDHVGGTSPEADVIIFDKFHVPAVLYKADEG